MVSRRKDGAKVVVTGIGPVSAVGRGVEAFWAATLGGEPVACPIPDIYERGYGWKSRFYVPCPKPEPSAEGLDKSLVRLMDKASLLACEAASLALRDAGFERRAVGRTFACEGLDRCAVVIGTGASHMDSAFRAHRAHLGLTGESFPMMAAACSMVNAPAAWISIFFGARGESLCLSTACSSATVAIGEAYEKIAAGKCDVAITGGVECLEDPYGTPMRGFDTLGALTRCDDGNPSCFSKRRSGFLFADGGACALVLEEEQHAQRRGAVIYAEITDFSAISEAYNIVQLDPSGRAITELLRELKGARRVDYLNAHGTGTIPNDAAEQAAIQACFGPLSAQPLVGSSKNQLGHTIAASGAFEAAVTALCLRHQAVPPLRIAEPLEELNLALDGGSTTLERAVSVSYGFGGHDAGLVFERREA